MVTTKLTIHDKLALTCSRTGTCCHGKIVLLNPWELACMAKEKKMTPREFRDLYLTFGGLRLKFDGQVGWKGQQACSQYVNNFGCSVHGSRPLVCRLFPLGRQIQSEKAQYMYQGDVFPCIEGCPEVAELPLLRVRKYIKDQKADIFEIAQDAYLEVMQNLADMAIVLFLDTGLAQSGDKKTLPLWRKMGQELPDVLADRIGQEWIDYLLLPPFYDDLENPLSFVQKHYDLLQLKAQEKFGALQTNQELHEASVLIMAVALHLSRGIGANPKELSELWIDTAKKHGGLE